MFTLCANLYYAVLRGGGYVYYAENFEPYFSDERCGWARPFMPNYTASTNNALEASNSHALQHQLSAGSRFTVLRL